MHIFLFYADDIAIISESENGMQQMLDKLDDWCNKWRIVIDKISPNYCISDQRLRM